MHSETKSGKEGPSFLINFSFIPIGSLLPSTLLPSTLLPFSSLSLGFPRTVVPSLESTIFWVFLDLFPSLYPAPFTLPMAAFKTHFHMLTHLYPENGGDKFLRNTVNNLEDKRSARAEIL
jgi:hypothetical protein